MNKDKNKQLTICGIYVDSLNTTTPVQLSVRTPTDPATLTNTFTPFAWGTETMLDNSVSHHEALTPPSALNQLFYFEGINNYTTFLQKHQTQGAIAIKPLEHQYLLQHNLRMFENLRFTDLIRCQLDIETATSSGAFSNPFKNRILAIGLKCHKKDTYLTLEEDSDAAEKKLLLSLLQYFKDNDPDTIEGHNIFKFDLEYLRVRSKLLGVKCLWGRFNREAQFRNSRLKVAERLIDFPRCDIPGRTVIDTYFLVQLYDISKREMPSYSLKKAAIYFGIATDNRTYLKAHSIQDAFHTDRKAFLAYLADDLYETHAIADLLLPTYFAQTQNFPMTFQEILLRGAVNKLETLFLEQYFHKKAGLPIPSKAEPFEGGYTKSFHQGVFKNVLHFDIASLYPSLLLVNGKNPTNDSLHCFIPLLKSFRSYRLEFKKKAASEPDPSLKKEYEARQQSFKILINSFYGYLGFNGALFGDSALAAEITKKGRDLLQLLIQEFEKAGCRILEVDTDGLYLEVNHCFSPEVPADLSAIGSAKEDAPNQGNLKGDTYIENGLYAQQFKNSARRASGEAEERTHVRDEGFNPDAQQRGNLKGDAYIENGLYAQQFKNSARRASGEAEERTHVRDEGFNPDGQQRGNLKGDAYKLLEKIKPSIPEGIELEFDGAYLAMFCYKAKNYALYDGTHLITKGSALKSRGFEPFLIDLTEALLKSLLGIPAEANESLPFLLKNIRESIENASIPIESLTKSEHLSISPTSYLKEVTSGGKPRRASLEAALKMNANLKMGDKVSYYIAEVAGAKKSTPDWQLAEPLSAYNAQTKPYSKTYYLQKLDDWLERYQPFIKEESYDVR